MEEDDKPKRNDTSKAVFAIREMEEKRKARRAAAAEEKKRQEEEEARYGSNPNWKIQKIVDTAREELPADTIPVIADEHDTEQLWRAHPSYNGDKILVCVRTRPLSKKETTGGDFRVLSFRNKQSVFVHDVKKAVDNSLKLENQHWKFDFAFDERNPNNEIYRFTLLPLIDSLFARGSKVSMFAYGQTGAGKSYTMMSIFEQSVNDMFVAMHSEQLFAHLGLHMSVSFYEVYQGKVFDLFASRTQLDVLEDGDGTIHLRGLSEMPANTPDQVLALLDIGQKVRATRATEMNDTSSRSHAILQVLLKNPNQTTHAQLTLIDLAGSEKGSDTPYSDKQTRNEAAEINKSLLSLKECIRALDMGSSHAPFRGSKLTMILRDSLIDEKSLSIMVACVGPAFSACEATINTLRYAERLKSATGGGGAGDEPLLEGGDENYDAIPVSKGNGLSDDEKSEVIARLRLLEQLREEGPKIHIQHQQASSHTAEDEVAPLVAQPAPAPQKGNARSASMSATKPPAAKAAAPQPPAQSVRKASAPGPPANLGGMADGLKKKPAAAAAPAPAPAKAATAAAPAKTTISSPKVAAKPSVQPPPQQPPQQIAPPQQQQQPALSQQQLEQMKQQILQLVQQQMLQLQRELKDEIASSAASTSRPLLASPNELIGHDVVEWMKSVGVAQEDAEIYAKALKDQGFDDADSLRDLKEEEMVTEIGMKKGHARKIVRLLAGQE